MRNLIANEDYHRKALPFIKDEYFNGEDKILFKQIDKFVSKYNQRPTIEALTIEIDAMNGVTEDEARACKSALASFNIQAEVNEQWLIDSTENFCQEKAIYQAMMRAIDIMNNKDNALQKGAIPSLLTEALAV